MRFLISLFLLLGVLDCYGQDPIYGNLIKRVDTFYSEYGSYFKGGLILANDDSATIRSIEHRTYKGQTVAFAVIRGGHRIALDSITEALTKKHSGSISFYQASNGIRYRVGDTIILGRGSAPNGDFRYLNIGGWGAALMSINGEYNSSAYNTGRGYSGYGLKIKRIVSARWRGTDKVYFVVGGGNITNYWLYIEDAIATCEIKDCRPVSQSTTIIQQPLSTADEILKFKKLLDAGAITQEEYEAQKAKMLAK